MNESRKSSKPIIHIQFTKEEFNSIYDRFSNSTCASLTAYARKKVLGKPVVVKYRNTSLDDFVTEMILLRNELHPIAERFGHSVERLQHLDTTLEINGWVLLNEEHRDELFSKIDQIKKGINQMADTWSQEFKMARASIMP